MEEHELQKSMETLRELFAAEALQKPDKYCQSDVNRIAEDNQYCYRFIKHQSGNVQKAFKMTKDCLKWRQEFKTNDINESNLNSKAFEAKILYRYFKDLQGRETLLVNVSSVYFNHELKAEDIKRITIYWLELLEKRDHDNKGILFLVNCDGAGMRNIDMGLVWFSVSMMTIYYPHFIHKVVVYNMPGVFTAIWNLVKLVLPKEQAKQITFVDSVLILEYIDASNLPLSMGGTNTYEYNGERNL